jgi:hypothetical protein
MARARLHLETTPKPAFAVLHPGVDFTDACNQHDLCYRQAGADKAACDRAFLDALLAECDRAVG